MIELDVFKMKQAEELNDFREGEGSIYTDSNLGEFAEILLF